MKLSGLLRAGWNLFDQIISSGTNALLSVLSAPAVGDSDFGGSRWRSRSSPGLSDGAGRS